jgi:hypothetical protein
MAARSEHLHVLLTPPERALVDLLAEREGSTASALLRRLLLREARVEGVNIPAASEAR